MTVRSRTRPRHRLRCAIAALATPALLGGLVACGSGGAAAPAEATPAPAAPAAGFTPVTLDNCGVQVRIEKPPQQALAISQPAIELLLTLGQAEHMSGAAGWNDPPPAALAAENAKVPQLGKEFPSFERALAADPDFVYTTFAYGFSAEGTAPREKFTDLGIATYLSPSECGGQDAAQTRELTFDDVFAEVGDVSRIFGVPDRGDQLVAQLRTRLAGAAQGLNASGVTLGWWYASTATPYMAGCCGAPGMVTKALGATNAFADGRQLWPETSWEAILARDPDVLVLADLTRGDDGDSADSKIKFLESDPVAQRLTAVKERRYIVVTASAMDPSLQNVDAVEKVAAGLRQLGVAGR